MWQIYILQCRDKTFYTGVTTDLKRRLIEHNTSKLGARYTRSRRPVKLVYAIFKQDRSSAAQEERRIKKLSRSEKLKIINK